MSSLRRFLHIERSRAATPEGDADPGAATAQRIEGVESPGRDPGTPAHSGAGLDRFGPPPPPSIELVATEAGERPFTRCMRCGMDHNVFATECSGCGANLDTEPQREFNEALWRARQAEAARETVAAAERREQRARVDAEDAAARRGAAESLAREVGDSERRRLDAELGPGGGRDVLAALVALLEAAWWLLGRLVRWFVRG